MGILQESNAVFYHPLDDTVESLQTRSWALVGGSLASAGKVGNALSTVGVGRLTDAPGGGYASASAATKLAFSAWVRKPAIIPFYTAPPAQALGRTDRAYLTAIGAPASMLGGMT